MRNGLLRGMLLAALLAGSAAGQNFGLQAVTAMFTRGLNGRPDAPLFQRNINGTLAFCRIPVPIKAADGTILCFCEIRNGALDDSAFAIYVIRSTDRGATWSPPILVTALSESSPRKVTNACPVVHLPSGRLHLTYLESDDASNDTNPAIKYRYSTDHGLNWSSETDISSTAIASGWAMVANGAHQGIQLQYQTGANASANGRLVMPYYHRKTAGGNYWFHALASDDNGTSWYRLGGVDDSSAGVNLSNEPCIIERTNGTLYAHVRRGQNVTCGYTTSTDAGATWASVSGVTGFKAENVQTSMIALGDGRVVAAAPSHEDDANSRKQFGVSYSTNDGATWSAPVLIDERWSAYSGMVPLSLDEFLVIYEGGYTGSGSTSEQSWAHHYKIARINWKWLTASPKLSYFLPFNERPAGKATHSGSPTLSDLGQYQGKAQPIIGSGTLNYVADEAGEVGIDFAGSNPYIRLADADLRDYAPEASQSFSAQICVDTTTSDCVLAENAVSGARWVLEIASGKPKFTISDGTNSPSVTGATSVNTGTRVAIAAVRDVAADTISVFINGRRDAAAVTDTTTGVLYPALTLETKLGQNHSGTGQLTGIVSWWQWDLQALAPSSLKTCNYRKPRPVLLPEVTATISGQPTAGSPLSIGPPGSCKLWLPDPDAPGAFYASASSTVAPQQPGMRLGAWFVGQYASAGYELAQGMPFSTAGSSRPPYAGYDATVGPHWRFNDWANASTSIQSGFGIAKSEGTLDHVQNTAVGTICGFLYPEIDTVNLTLMDTNNNAAAAGFTLNRKYTTDKLEIQIHDGTAYRLNASNPTYNFTEDNWHFFAIVFRGRGAGNEPQLYANLASDANADSTAEVYASGSGIGGSDGSYASSTTHRTNIGGLATSNNGTWNGRLRGVSVWNVALTQAQIEQVYQFFKGHANHVWSLSQ